MSSGGRTILAGVMGWPVAHSRSPRLHGYWLRHYRIDGAYLPLAVAPDDFPAALEGLAALGFAAGVPRMAADNTAASDTSVGAPPVFPERIGPVNDFADVLDPEMEDSIAALVAEVRESTGGEIVVVTIGQLNGWLPRDAGVLR